LLRAALDVQERRFELLEGLPLSEASLFFGTHIFLGAAILGTLRGR